MNKAETEALEERYAQLLMDAIDAYAMFNLFCDLLDDMVREHPFLDPEHAKALNTKKLSLSPHFKPYIKF